MKLFLSLKAGMARPDPVKGMRIITYNTHRPGGGEALHPYLRRFESSVLEGQAVYRACQKLRDEGWIPDWVLNHVGFGNGMYLSDAFPEAKRIGLFEWFYRAVGLMWISLDRPQWSLVVLASTHLECPNLAGTR